MTTHYFNERMNIPLTITLVILFLFAVISPASSQQYDIVIREGTVYDGGGLKPFVSDIGIIGDSIAFIGVIPPRAGKDEIKAKGLAVAPGFINMLSQGQESMIEDGRAKSDVMQGVTLEVLGEGFSMGPINADMKKDLTESQADLKYDISWNTLGEYLSALERKGISPNVASYIGATNVRGYYLGLSNRTASPAELDSMKRLVKQGMREGALGLSSALIYTPGVFASTDELIALAKVASQYGGIYASHIRSEGNNLLSAVDELIRIAREANIPAEIFHFKAAGTQNWDKLDTAISMITAAQASGLKISADMYLYTAAATGLDASMPPWVQEGGYDEWVRRLKDPKIRARLKKEMATPGQDQGWENFYFDAGNPERVLLVGFKADSLKKYTGMTLMRVAAMRNETPEDAMIDLVIADGSRVGAVYFLMIEPGVRKVLKLPWVSFCSDEQCLAPEGALMNIFPHPRAYGAFARLLGKYVRDEGRLPLEKAIHRLTAMPAGNLHITRRGSLKPGQFADIVIFDPGSITDHATFDRPHQLSTGVRDVLVNGTLVVSHGEHTNAKPGRIVRGPGWNKP